MNIIIIIKEKEPVLKIFVEAHKDFNCYRHNPVYTIVVDDKSRFGKLAITSYELNKYIGENSLIDIEIKTGRKNQIRVQLSNYGYPIIGDKKYGGKKTFYNRLMLHANLLILIHPVTNEKLELIARTPKEFTR